MSADGTYNPTKDIWGWVPPAQEWMAGLHPKYKWDKIRADATRQYQYFKQVVYDPRREGHKIPYHPDLRSQIEEFFPHGIDLSDEQWLSLQILSDHDVIFRDQPMYMGDFSMEYGKRAQTHGSRKRLFELEDRRLVSRENRRLGAWFYWQITKLGKAAIKYRELTNED